MTQLQRKDLVGGTTRGGWEGQQGQEVRGQEEKEREPPTSLWIPRVTHNLIFSSQMLCV